LLNCYVIAYNKKLEGQPLYRKVLDTASTLAIITKSGGGTGINGDFIDTSADKVITTSRVYLYLPTNHPDYTDFRRWQYFDSIRNDKVTYTRRCVDFAVSPTADKHTTICVEDSMLGIMAGATHMVEAMARNEDIIVDLSQLRPFGSSVKAGGTSSGAASFAIEIFDNIAHWCANCQSSGAVNTLRYVFAPILRVIRQSGTRRGAGMFTLSLLSDNWKSFLEAKTLDNEAKLGDIRTFNMSFLVDDSSMKSKIGRERLKALSTRLWETGEPAVLFVDTINKLSSSDEWILSTNPCGEIGLTQDEACNLGNINLANLVGKSGFLFGEFKRLVNLGVRALDAVYDVTKYPTKEIEAKCRSHRRIGLGFMGLAEALVKMNIAYDSRKAVNFCRKLSNIMRTQAIKTSKYLALENGVSLPNGLRNIALLTVPPTGTTSMLYDTSSGIEPYFSAMTYRRVGAEVLPYLLPMLEEYVTDDTRDDILLQIQRDNGSIKNTSLPEALRKVLRTAHDISPKAHVEIQAAVQQGFDGKFDTYNKELVGNSISKTINLPYDSDVQSIYELLEYAHVLGLKGITVYRDGSRSYQPLNITEPTSCSTGTCST
jgi:ribonucleoside-diphosphate reductase alpha chain